MSAEVVADVKLISHAALADVGIAGRGVLLDFYAYALEKKLDYEPWSQYGRMAIWCPADLNTTLQVRHYNGAT